MPTFIRYGIRIGLISAALMPTAIALLFAGIMIGKPKPCEVQSPCKTSLYSTEVLLLPLFTLLPVAATAAFFCTLRKEND